MMLNEIEYPRDQLCSWAAFLAPIFAAIGGGSAAAGVATAIGTAATVAAAGTSIAQATKAPPKMGGPEAVNPPDAAQATAAVAQERTRTAQRSGYRSTMLSSQLAQYSANPTGKTTLGG